VLAPVLASLALMGGDQQPVCHGQLRPPTKVERAMRYRRLFGLPSDRAHVRRIQRSDARGDDQGFRFTPREWRYWRMRARIELSDKSRLERYLDRHPGLLGGTSIEDDWPTGPYLLIQLTRDQAVHDAALQRIFPHRLRTVLVQYPREELEALQDRISADDDALAAEGFDVRGLHIDTEANRVAIQMVSARTDHQAYFEARYGPAVFTFATAESTRLECEELDRVRVSSSGRSLRLDWTYSRGDEFERVEVVEHADRVEIGIVLRVDFFFRYGDARPDSTRIQLSRPLGKRRLIDAATGRPAPTSLHRRWLHHGAAAGEGDHGP
jgi:hypothetical protein